MPQLQCQEADSCPTGDKAGAEKNRPCKNIETDREAGITAPTMIKQLEHKLTYKATKYSLVSLKVKYKTLERGKKLNQLRMQQFL